jgi:hypothetical protein
VHSYLLSLAGHTWDRQPPGNLVKSRGKIRYFRPNSSGMAVWPVGLAAGISQWPGVFRQADLKGRLYESREPEAGSLTRENPFLNLMDSRRSFYFPIACSIGRM